MRYTNRTIVISRSRIREGEQRIAFQRKLVERLESADHPVESAIARLLLMEQSLLSMKRFLATLERNLERDLERSFGLKTKPHRSKAKPHRTETDVDAMAQQVVNVLSAEGIEAKRVDRPPTVVTEAGSDQQGIELTEVERAAEEFAAQVVKSALQPAADGLQVFDELAQKSKRPDATPHKP